MAAPNLMNLTTVTAKIVGAALTTSNASILTNSSGSNKVFKVNSLIVANVDGVNSADITVEFFRSSVAYDIAKTIAVPADATLVVISKETVIYLEEGDSLRCQASANSDLEAICSYEEIG